MAPTHSQAGAEEHGSQAKRSGKATHLSTFHITIDVCDILFKGAHGFSSMYLESIADMPLTFFKPTPPSFLAMLLPVPSFIKLVQVRVF